MGFQHIAVSLYGVGNQLITQEEVVGGQTGHVVRRERFGGLLSYYHREAA
jgi:hypothetical protein